MAYISEEVNSTRERYILVAEIDVVIIQGVWNICVVERRK
jgi:hypothetical protein